MTNFKKWMSAELTNFSFVVDKKHRNTEKLRKDFVLKKLDEKNKVRKRTLIFLILFILTTLLLELVNLYLLIPNGQGIGAKGVENQSPETTLTIIMYFIFGGGFILCSILNYFTYLDSRVVLNNHITQFKNGLFYSVKNKRVDESTQMIKNNPKMKKELLEYGKKYELMSKKDDKRTRNEKLFYSHLYYNCFHDDEVHSRQALLVYLKNKVQKNVLIVN